MRPPRFLFLVLPRALAGVAASLLALAVGSPAAAESPASSPALRPGLTVELRDLTGRFLEFHAAAEAADDRSPDHRWELWRKLYNFAAVPPTPQGLALARQELDSVWPRYAPALPQIRQAPVAVRSEAADALARVASLLEFDAPLDVQLLLFVGTFDGNAFTTSTKGRPVVAVPAESPAADRRPTLTHEFTHVVHIALGGISGSWQRSLAEAIVAEGLAMHVTQRIHPDYRGSGLIEIHDGWLAQAESRAAAILSGALSHLAADNSDTLFRFTAGVGPGGLKGEAYYAGWIVVGHWLSQGETLAAIARYPRAELEARVEAALVRLLEAAPARR